MKEEGYYKRWLIPQIVLNDKSDYASRPVGNLPEFMHLENSLNNNIQLSIYIHCAITAHLSDDDERKFSMATPLRIVKSIERIWGKEGNVLNSHRILQDYDKALYAFRVVYEASGKMVPKLGNRSGHRNHAAGMNRYSWRGVRVKKLLVEEIERWLHLDALEVKIQRTVKLIQTLTNQDGAETQGLISSEGEEEDDSDNDSV